MPPDMIKFLLVDDVDENLLALEGLLRREGLEILKANSGTEALELLLVHEVALAILDVQMPGMDGFELAEIMRSTSRTGCVPIIFLTAGGIDENRRFRGYETGAVDFLFKPVEPHVLRSKADVFFDLYQQRQEVGRQRDELRVLLATNAQLLNQTRQNAEALKQSQSELQKINDNTPDIIVRFDHRLRQVYVNKAASSLFSLPTESILGKTMGQLGFPNSFCNVIENAVRDVFESRTVCHVEVTRETEAGTQFFSSRLMPELSDDGAKVEHVLSVTHDITDRKHAEEVLKEADRRKDEFIATLAHELRNPLAPIRNAIELLKLHTHTESGDLNTIRELMDRQVHHLTRLVDDLLEISRITQGKLELRKDRILLTGVVENAIESARPIIESASHTFALSVPKEPIWLDADATRLSQVFTNLLNNSAKYTPKGGKIWMNVRQYGSEVEIAVSDNGIGIPTEHLGRVFKMFSQVTPAIERSQGGLGIGLALVKGLVELHDGYIEAFSGGEGQGSKFVVRLPVSKSDSLEEGQSIDLQSDSTDHNPFKVLVVDDNCDAANSLAMLLQLLGHETMVSHDPIEALAIAEYSRPQLILLDIGLPRVSGYEVARRIRSQNWGKKVTLIAQSGWGQEEDKQRANDAGFDHHMTKPIDHKHLTDLLNSIYH